MNDVIFFFFAFRSDIEGKLCNKIRHINPADSTQEAADTNREEDAQAQQRHGEE